MYNTTENMSPIIQQKPTSHGKSVAANTALIILLLLVILNSGFLMFYATILHPTELTVQATAVVNTILTNQTQTTVTNSPQFLYTQLTNRPLTFYNSMNTPMGGWDTDNIGNSSCKFTDGAYHIHVANDHIYLFCINSEKDYSNFVFQIQMTILNGSEAGLLLRSSNQTTEGYSFAVTSNGLYNTEVITNNLSGGKLFQFGRDTTLHNGLKQSELLTVIARGKHFIFYINKHFISSFDDNTFSTGLISLFAINSERHNDVDVAFNNAQLWLL